MSDAYTVVRETAHYVQIAPNHYFNGEVVTHSTVIDQMESLYVDHGLRVIMRAGDTLICERVKS